VFGVNGGVNFRSSGKPISWPSIGALGLC
jgi:hypothetical protein